MEKRLKAETDPKVQQDLEMLISSAKDRMRKPRSNVGGRSNGREPMLPLAYHSLVSLTGV